jgi:hypothetical protein
VPDPQRDSPLDLARATHRAVGVALYNHVWTLLKESDRSPDEIDEMIHAAHASRYHWSLAEGTTEANLGRGEWLCARVYAVLGRGEPALWHARRCVDHVSTGAGADWDLAAAYEAMARAFVAAQDHTAAAEWKSKATAALARIADPDDREVIERDLADLPV